MSTTPSARSSYPLLPAARISSRVAAWAGITGMALALPVAYLALLVPASMPDASAIERNTQWISGMGPFFWFLQAVVIAPVLEEILFRGVFLQLLRRVMPLGVAVVGLAGLFALGHLRISLQNVFLAFVLGLFLSWLVVRSNSLAPGIICHAGTNFFFNYIVRPLVDPAAGRGMLVQPAILILMVGSVVVLVVGIGKLRAQFSQGPLTPALA